jgi:hypothetical protein
VLKAGIGHFVMSRAKPRQDWRLDQILVAAVYDRRKQIKFRRSQSAVTEIMFIATPLSGVRGYILTLMGVFRRQGSVTADQLKCGMMDHGLGYCSHGSMSRVNAMTQIFCPTRVGDQQNDDEDMK